MAIIKCHSGKSPIRKVINYVKNPVKTNDQLISSMNCSVDNVKKEMAFTKSYHKKKDGVQYFHVIQSFPPGEVTPEKCHELGNELAKKIAPNYECLVVTHTDKDHLHNHIVINSVSYKDGKKYQIEKGAYKIKAQNDKICEREKLSIIKNENVENVKNEVKNPKKKDKPKAMSSNEYRAAKNKDVEWWKGQVILDIREIKLQSKSKEDFIRGMEEKGYQVKWKDTSKYITYTTPEGKKVRDNKLHDESLLKEAMENGFRQLTSREYDRGTKGEITGTSTEGIIERTIRESIERDKQELRGAENSISKPIGTNIYSELTSKEQSSGINNKLQRNDGITKSDVGETRGDITRVQDYSTRAISTDGQVHKVSSEGSTTRGLQESTQTREIENNISGKGNFNDDRSISNSDNMPINIISDKQIKEGEVLRMEKDKNYSENEKRIKEEQEAFREARSQEERVIAEKLEVERREAEKRESEKRKEFRNGTNINQSENIKEDEEHREEEKENEVKVEEVIKELNIQVQNQADIKDIDKEIQEARGDKELQEDLMALKKYYDNQAKDIFKGVNEFQNQIEYLVKNGGEIVEKSGYIKGMSEINRLNQQSYKDLKVQESEMIELVKGESKEQINLKEAQKAYDYLNKAEERIQKIKSENKILDIKGNYERGQIIKDIRKEMDTQREILERTGLNNKEDFNKLQKEVADRLEWAKELIKNQKEKDQIEKRELEKVQRLEQEKGQVADKNKESLEQQRKQQELINKRNRSKGMER